MKRGFSIGLAWLALAALVGAIPAPELIGKYFERAQLVVVGRIEGWQRTSWVWQNPEIHESQVTLESVLKGTLTQKTLRLRIQVYPDLDGGHFTRTPPAARRILFLDPGEDGTFKPIMPAPYALQPPTEENLAQLGQPR